MDAQAERTTLDSPVSGHPDVAHSTDPHFVEKLRDVVGLYVSPPERAIVLSFDEKSPIQALAGPAR